MDNRCYQPELSAVVYDEYDVLIQLCDALAKVRELYRLDRYD